MQTAIGILVVAILSGSGTRPDAGVLPPSGRDDSQGPRGQACGGGQGVTPPPRCDDRLKNGTESDVDCGGSCPRCVAGRACQVRADCQSDQCVARACVEASMAHRGDPLALGCSSRTLCTFAMTRAQVDGISLNGLAMQGKIVPAFKDGVCIGLKFFGLAKGSLYEKVGIRDNDILLTINGLEVGDGKTIEKTLQDAVASGGLEGVFDRYGERLTVRVEIR